MKNLFRMLAMGGFFGAGGSSGSDGSGSQPDWNQNDSTAPDYVKNRTHWMDENGEVHKIDLQYLPDDIGGAETFEFIGEFTLGEDVEQWIITEDANGNPIKLKKMYFELSTQPAADATGNTDLMIANPAFPENLMFGTNIYYVKLSTPLRTTAVNTVSGGGVYVEHIPAGNSYNTIARRSVSALNCTWSSGRNYASGESVNYLGGIAMKTAISANSLIGADSIIKIWGVRV